MEVKQIHVFAPSNLTLDIATILTQFKNMAQRINVAVKHSDSLMQNYDHAWYSAPFEVREQALYDALKDDDSQIIWAMRGGSGAAELLSSPRICQAIEKVQNKILVGFSDITSLHLAFNKLTTIPTIHGPVVTSVVKYPKGLDEVMQITQGEKLTYNLSPLNSHAMNQQEIEGKIIGGNLAVFASMLSTNFIPDLQDKILLLEDVNEAGYQLVRYFNQLSQAGVVENCKTVLLGEFTKSDQYCDFAMQNILARFLVDIPVYKINQIGHIENNRPILFNNDVQIQNQQLTARYKF